MIALFLGAQTSQARANVPGGAVEGPPVTLTERGRAVVLANGIVAVTIDVPSAAITSILYRRHEMVSTGGGHRSIYFSREGGAAYENLPHCVGNIVTRTPDTVDISCRHIFTPSAGDKQPWNVDVHFILRRGASGVYIYADCSHPADYPTLTIGEWRMVWSTPERPSDELPNLYVDQQRHWRAPTPAELAHDQPVPGAPKEVTLVTEGPWAGRLDCKYMYAGTYWNMGCWGAASDVTGIGGWVVFGSHEFFSDGPNKQDLDIAVGTTLVHLNMNHYGGTQISVPQGQAWDKFYGPWLIYFNDKGSGDKDWHDAQTQAIAESTAWPYDWVKDRNYPLQSERGQVAGKLIVRDALKPLLTANNAWVGLAAPETGPNTDFQFQASGYQFWVHAAADGSFDIPAVRPGNYELYAYTNGVVGEYGKTGITVNPGETLRLGNLVWNVPHHGSRIAWEIGIPDRSAAEFADGNQYFDPLLYKTLWTQVPNPLDFTIGQSDPAKDWYYAQTRHGSPPNFQPARWRIHFNLDDVPAGNAALTLAFAGADRAHLGVYINNEPRPIADVSPTVQGGNGLIREAVHTFYSVSYVTFPTAHLRQGENTITLVQESTREDSSYIMYDYLNMELP